MIEAIVIFLAISGFILLIARYHAFKEIGEQFYDLSDDGSSEQDAVQPDSREQVLPS